LRRATEHILLVEDEQVVRDLVTEMLEREGYDVTSCGDPEEALSLPGVASYDLLITDVVMPKLNGRQLATTLLERAPSLKVLYVSGYTSTAIVERGVLDEDVAFLQKPFSLAELVAKVRASLDAE
jgi:DNA-binding response OmpR family regulator